MTTGGVVGRGTAGLRRCPSCGWPNESHEAACSFCTAPLERADGTTSLRVELATCPHCGVQTPGADLLGRCPHCRRGYQESRTQVRSAAAHVVLATRGVEPVRLWLGIALVATVAVVIRLIGAGNDPTVRTAENVNRLGEPLRLFAAAHGGFPGNLDALDAADVPSHLLTDGWGREVRYRALGSRMGYSPSGVALYPSCELRSAGPNGEPGDADDLLLHEDARAAAESAE